MKPNSSKLCFVMSAVLLWGSCGQISASPASSLLKGLSKYLSKEAAGEMSEKLLKEVGEESLERLTTRVVREGGEESLEKATSLIAKHGSDVIRAIDNVPHTQNVLRALDELPASKVSAALQSLARGSAGRELAELTNKYGSKVILAELQHPGIGRRFVEIFGDDGLELSTSLSRDQAIALGRHLKGLATATPTQKTRIAGMIKGEKDAFFKWLGKFVDNHPGKILTAGVILANIDKILGEAGSDDGSKNSPKTGLVPRFFPTVIEKSGQAIDRLNWIIVTFVGALAALMIISLILRMRRTARRSRRDDSESIGSGSR